MSSAVIEQFRERLRAGQPLRIRGGGSKDFYGNALSGEVLDTREHTGIVNYEASELVITAKAGTPLAELKSALAERRQWLPFEPPEFAAGSTVGGMVAAGLSGPGRLAHGAVRDYILGVTLMDGEGRVLKFGGEVMKNVAGFDVSRLMAGSLGSLGLLLEVSIKVLPVPVAETTLRIPMSEVDALAAINRWAGQPLPITATTWVAGELFVRLAGADAAVKAAVPQVGAGNTAMATIAASDAPWAALRDHTHDFFAGDAPLWRLALPTTTPALNLGASLIEWGGGQRWLRGELDAERLRALAREHGGHATRFRGGDKNIAALQPLDPVALRLHQELKRRFDPQGVFNPGRLF